MISQEFRFYLYLNDQHIEVCPLVSDLKFAYKKDDRWKTKRFNLSTELTFHNNDIHNTFDALYEIERQCDICHRVDIRIDILCDGVWTEYYNGYIPFRKGSYDLDACTVTVPIRTIDEYTCLDDIYKTDFNLLEIADRISANAFKGVLECVDDTFSVEGLPDTTYNTIPSPPSSPLLPFSVATEYTAIKDVVITNGGLGSETTFTYTGTWCRIRYEGATAPDDSYTEIEPGVWVKSPILTENGVVFDFNADNGLRLRDVFEYFFNMCGITICSDFFDINPVGDAPDNIEYQYAANYLQNVAVYQASDIIYADAQNNATRFMKSLKEFWEDISLRYKLVTEYDEVNGCMRIEHESWREENTYIDLTLDRFAEYMHSNNSYEYDNDRFPRREIFADKLETTSIAFNDAYIDYPIACSSDDDATNEQKHAMQCTITDVEYIYNNRELLDDTQTLLSMVLISLDSDNLIIRNNDKYNYNMSWTAIIENLWLRRRPLSQGVMNGKNIAFISVLPQRIQKDVFFVLCCAELMQFKAGYKYLTNLGLAEASDDISITYPGRLIELDLLHTC